KDAARATLRRRHQRLEGTSQHFRIDGRLGPRCRFLARYEPKALKEPLQQYAKLLVRKQGTRSSPLYGRAIEQAAVEKGNAAELSRHARSLRDRRVQRSKKQRK